MRHLAHLLRILPLALSVAFLASGAVSAGVTTSAGWIGEGEQMWEQFGNSVAVGDVNGDGYDDVLVGAYSKDWPGQASTNMGRAYLFLGSASGPATRPDWSFDGENPNDEFGRAVAVAWDVDGDGDDELLVSAWNYAGEGKVYLFLGSPSGPSAAPDWTARAPGTTGFGRDAAGAGDVNGDGYGDIVVSCTGCPNEDGSTGRALVWYGSPGGLGENGTAANADWVAVGDEDGPIATNVASAGDVNGDGYDDIIFGSPGYARGLGQSSEGWAFVFEGSPQGPNGGLTGTPDNAAWTAQSDQQGGVWGTWVASPGDVNGDGYDEVILGAMYWEDGPGSEGAAFLWLGDNRGLGDAGTVGNADWWAEGEEIEARFGCVKHVGDLNGDGYDDVAIGGENAGGGTGRGRVYVWMGGARHGPDRTGLGDPGLPSNADWTLEGKANGDNFGEDVAGGDVDGDGFVDLVATSMWADDAEGVSVGRAYVFRGTCGELDVDGDGLASSSDPLCGPDDATDCDDSDAGNWGRPGEVRNLVFAADRMTLRWTAPWDSGAAFPAYDTLRSENPSDFATTAWCAEQDDASDREAVDPQDPPEAGLFSYLTRAESACPDGEGTIGTDWAGTERIGRACP